MNQPPASLLEFQRSYAKFLRAPHHNKRPKGIPYRQSKVYESLLFNNICSFINQCFPVAKSVISETKWRRLNRVFFRDWQCKTPYFGQIPKEFVDYLQSADAPNFIPAWLPDLAHYEWLELNVDTHTAPLAPVQKAAIKSSGSTEAAADRKLEYSQEEIPQLKLSTNPTLQIAHYSWPVHQISASQQPTPRDTHLLVYRTSSNKVEFMEVNTLTAGLLELMEQSPAKFSVTIESLARLLGQADATQLQIFAIPIVQELIIRQVLWIDI